MGWLSQYKFKLFGLSIFVAVALYINFAPHRTFGVMGGAQGTSPLMQSTTSRPPTYALHVLFIGNSYTYVHDIPKQLVEIASSDPGNPTQFIVQSVTRGSIGLKELWHDGSALDVLQQARWDYVVLQEQGFWAMFVQSTEITGDYAGRFAQAIRQAGARPFLYLTWVRKPGSKWYTDPKTAFLESPDYMMQRLSVQTHALGKTIGAPVVEVGWYWMRALKEQPSLELYEPDGSHPGLAGSYLAALVFYKTFSGRDVTKITFQPDGLPPQAAEQIRSLVSQPLHPGGT